MKKFIIRILAIVLSLCCVILSSNILFISSSATILVNPSVDNNSISPLSAENSPVSTSILWSTPTARVKIFFCGW